MQLHSKIKYGLHRATSFFAWLSIAVLFFFLLLSPSSTHSQNSRKRTRILFLLDASSSMTYPWSSNYNRFEIASTILLKIMDSIYSINNEIEFAVRAYGTNYPAQKLNCYDTELEVPFNFQNTNQIKTRLKNITPIGSSPIAYSLRKASENELSDAALFDYSVIFITDGGESCNGDVCGVFQELLQKKISVKPYVIGLDKENPNLKSYYNCLGNYVEVSTPEDIQKAIELIVEANKALLDKPKQLNLKTTFSNVEPVKKDTLVVVPVKKDTVVTPVVKIDSLPKEERKNFSLNKLKNFKQAIQKNEIVSISFARTALPIIKQVTLNFDLREPKKVSADFPLLDPFYMGSKLKPAKATLAVKKPNIKPAKKASLRFEYEEPKKLSPDFDYLVARYKNVKLKTSNASILAKKPNIKPAKKASLRFEYEEPKKISPTFETLLAIYKNIKLKQSIATIASKKSPVKPYKKASLRFEYEVAKKYPMAVIKFMAYPRRYSYAYKMPETKLMEGKRKAVLHFKVDEPKVVKKDTIVPSFPLGTSVDFTTEDVMANGTRVQVYFKGTNGKTYPTAKPQILIQDAKSNQTVKSFHREMSNGEPTPQNVVAGTYNIVVKGFDDLYAYNVELKANTTTKVYIKVNDGTLQFRYKGNIKRPVKEYKATVKRLFENVSTFQQPCAEAKMYEPGTYHVDIDCLPPLTYNVELTFDANYEIQLDEPGTLAIMNSNKLGTVQIQKMRGDKYLTFYTIEIAGNPEKQRVQLISGATYKLVYPSDPNVPQLGTKDLLFKLKPNNTLELELK